MILLSRQRQLDLHKPCVMGVLNVTPDSFSDGGRFNSALHAVEYALAMIEEGAAIIDIGGESTRPGAAEVGVDEELERVVPVVEALRARTEAWISVDTSSPEVMESALQAGADMVNDVRALRRPGAFEVILRYQPAVCLMHMSGEPGTMQQEINYQQVVPEVLGYLRARTDLLIEKGLPRDHLLIDPGFGFGKLASHNLELLHELKQFTGLGLPVLVGLSRKSLLQALTGRGVEQRLAGSVALAALAVERGAAVVRAHDVAATVDAVRVAEAVRSGELP